MAHSTESGKVAPSGLSPKAALWIGILAGGWIATLVLVGVFFVSDGSLALRDAAADDDTPGIPLPGGGEIPLPDIGGSDGNSIDPSDATNRPRGVQNPGGGTSDSNRTAIALSASIGGGQSVVYYFDTVNQRVLVYQYAGRLVSGSRALRKGDRGGLRLLAARHMDYDLRLNGYRDLSERTRNDLKALFDAEMAKQGGKKAPGGLPVKKLNMGGSKK